MFDAFEPLVRLSWGGPSRSPLDDHGVLATPGVIVHFVGRNKIAANLDLWFPAAGETEISLKVQSYLHF